jgi:hypothetical protein
MIVILSRYSHGDSLEATPVGYSTERITALIPRGNGRTELHLEGQKEPVMLQGSVIEIANHINAVLSSREGVRL